ncbi:MAG TPA: tetratricopeptide repeat protein [Bacteroidales bacterium]
MAKKKNTEVKGDQRLENIEESLGKTEQFIVNNQKVITGVIAVIVLIVLGYFGFSKYYLEPKTEEAYDQMYSAQFYFQIDSLDKALYGDGNHLGFADIAEEYSMTKPGNLANYYAGICLLRKGKFSEAIEYLEEFDAEDELVRPMAIGAIGDAYMELGKNSDAASYYVEAADFSPNEFTAPLFLYKAGETYELMGEYGKAIDIYQTIKDKYSKSNEARTIEKNIGRATALKNQK